MGTRHQLSGLLFNSSRGPILEVDGGGVYALDLDRDVRSMIGGRVTIEGVRSGFDRTDVEWIGEAAAR